MSLTGGFPCVCLHGYIETTWETKREKCCIHIYTYNTYIRYSVDCETYYNATIPAESCSDSDYPCPKFNVGTWKPQRPGRCHVQRHLLLAGIDLMSVHAVQRGAASRFIELQRRYIVIVESASWERTKSRIYCVIKQYI